MTATPDEAFDWTTTTWKGSRRQQHREFHALPFARKLELIEEMSVFARQFQKQGTKQNPTGGPRADRHASNRSG